MPARLITDPIERDVSAGVPFTIAHGLGRQIGGYLPVWSSAPVRLHVPDPAADTRENLTLVADATCTLRLVLL